MLSLQSVLLLNRMAEDKKILEWEAPEFGYIEKEPAWFLSAGLIAAVFLIFAIWQKNLLFAIFIIVATIVVFVWAKKEPEMLLFKLNESGLGIGDRKFYPWSNLEHFSLIKSHVEQDKFAELMVRRDEKINPLLKIHIPPGRLDEIREFLHGHLKEEEYEESFMDAIERIAKF